MIIKFDNTTIDSDSIIELTQQADVFDSSFKLGSTICNAFTMCVMKDAVNSTPSIVTLNDDNNNVLYTLNVDEVSDEDDDYYRYTLVDNMVKFNVIYDWSEVNTQTAQGILNAMCNDLISKTAPTITYGGDINVAYDGETSARQFISYIAEINGSIARINASGSLEFVAYSNSITKTIDYDTCEDISVGELHTIKNVFVELGTASKRYPITEVEGDTVYISSSNILLTDSGSYSIQGILQHIHSIIDGFRFYNIDIERCTLDQTIKAGDVVNIDIEGDAIITQDGYQLITQSGDTIICQDTYLPFIANIDWNFYKEWNGGFSLDVDTQKQEETSIIQPDKATQSIKIKVDRELNTISQEVADIESNVTRIDQTATDLSITVSSTSSELQNITTKVIAQADGVYISNGIEGTYSKFDDSGMEIYVNNDLAAQATSSGFIANKFKTPPWEFRIQGNALNIVMEDN